MNLAISFRSELLKTKRTASWYFAIIIAIIVSVIFVLTVAGNDSSPKINPWTAIFNEEFKSLNLLVLPLFTILVCTLLPQIEYRNNTWKQVHASPQKIVHIYLSKFLMVQALLVLFLVIFLASAVLCALLCAIAHPSLLLLETAPDWYALVQKTIQTYVSILAVSVIQFNLGLILKNFIAPIATGFLLWLLGNVLLFEMHSSLTYIFPYSFSAMTAFPQYNGSSLWIGIASAGLSITMLAGGYFLYIRKLNK